MISVTNFIKYMELFEIEVKEEEIEELNCLADKNGQITKQTLKKFVKISWFWEDVRDKVDVINSDLRKVEMAFKGIDVNKSDSVTKKEFNKTFKILKPKQTEAIFNKFDQDGDGKLSFEEFKIFMNSRKFKHQRAPIISRKKKTGYQNVLGFDHSGKRSDHCSVPQLKF